MTAKPNDESFTTNLSLAKSGDRGAEEKIWDTIYEHLKKLAHGQLFSMRRGGTVNTTSLVHELYVKLAGSKAWHIKDRNHFLALSCQAMRHILVQHARHKGAAKRKDDQFCITVNDEAMGASSSQLDVLTLDEALKELKEVNERLVQVVELRIFGGFNPPEIAKILDASSRTIERDWLKAKIFLYERLQT